MATRACSTPDQLEEMFGNPSRHWLPVAKGWWLYGDGDVTVIQQEESLWPRMPLPD
ncbi:MAG: hypothetical protein WCJ99_10170 [Betaproteobacteria bacterium]